LKVYQLSLQERVVYNKEIQTAALDEDTGPSIEDLRQQLRQEYEQVQQLQKDKELEEEAAKLDKAIEEEIRGWSSPYIVKIPSNGLPRTDGGGAGDHFRRS
jgi:hypothetical protein